MQTAKNKPLSKEERLRNLRIKANAKAAKALPNLDEAKMREDVITSHNRAEGSIRVYAMYLNNRFAEQMKAFTCHWSAFTKANCRTDNEIAILQAVDEERKALKALAEAKGHVNPDMPWSRTKAMAKELHQGNAKREREPKRLDERLKADLSKLYKAAMKEERPSENELTATQLLGKALIALGVDLSTLGV